MKRFWIDHIAIIAALVGIVLMALTIVWRVNPVEGSVIPRFLTDNSVGMGILWVLLVTCMPVWILSVALIELISLPLRYEYIFACGAMLTIQGMLYFMIGKVISLCLEKLKRRSGSSNSKSEHIP